MRLPCSSDKVVPPFPSFYLPLQQKMRFFILLFFVSWTWNGFTQSHHQVSYLRYSNDKLIENQDTILLLTAPKTVVIGSTSVFRENPDFPYEYTWFNPQKLGHIHHVSYLKSDKGIAMIDSASYMKYDFQITEETKEILGYTCKKALVKINSNNITLWFTNLLEVYGGPYPLGSHLGLVLEYDRNSTFTIRANEIELDVPRDLVVFNMNVQLPYYTMLDYRDLVWKSRFTQIPVFENQIVNFGAGEIMKDIDLTTSLRFANGTLVAKKVKFPEIPEGNHLFVDAKIQSNGDAYDRTASVLALPTQGKQTIFEAFNKGSETLPIFKNSNGKAYQGVVSTATYQAPLELMRLFTSFGIKHFNHIDLKDKNWHDEARFRQDITELSPVFSEQELWIVVFIGNYDQGGHIVDLNFTIHSGDTKVFPSKQVVPLFNTTNIMEMAGQEYATMFSAPEGLSLKFTLEKPIKNAYLRYISTGHGGWGNGDEFLPKVNTIEFNGSVLHQFIPWRQDCGSFRLFNPASGNFSNGLSSSDYSRSNWCPGTLTNPEFIFMGDLPAGTHEIRVRIPMGENEGSSFSAWNVSGVIFGE